MSREIDPESADEPAPAGLDRIREATSLGELVAILDAESLHEAYFRAKERWRAASVGAIRPTRPVEGFPGDAIRLDDVEVAVHGVTHADSDPERTFVREHVEDFIAADAAVYCEQGIREMYLADVPVVCEMDDYRWAMAACDELDRGGTDATVGQLDNQGEGGGHVAADDREAGDGSPIELERVVADLSSVGPELRDATFSLIESGRDLYGEEFATALGDVADSLLSSHEDAATGQGFEAFRLSRAAARDPTKLAALQRYFWRAFLPQPLEREWLRRHDPELELLTHARNERMADYVVHEATASDVHVLVGAAHQPGVASYLRQYRTGEKTRGDFEYVA